MVSVSAHDRARVKATGPTSEGAALPDRLPPRPRVVIEVTALMAFVLSFDPTMVAVANPRIADSLHASLQGTQWITGGFLLTLSVLLVPCGSLGDRLGGRRMLAAGLVGFTAGAVLAAFSGAVGELVGARLLMGAGAAAMQPAAVSAYRAAFPPAARSRAAGLWAATAVSGSAIAPVLTGAILGFAPWRVLFVGMATIGLILLGAVILGLRGLPRHADDVPLHAVRNVGLALGIGLLTWALIRAGAMGWSAAEVVGSAVAGILMLLAVGGHIARADSRGGLDGPPIAASIGIVVLSSIGYLGTVFLLGIMLQRIGDGTPLQVGLELLPFLGVAGAVSSAAGRIQARVGGWWMLVAATGLELVGLFGLTQVTAATRFSDLWLWLLFLGVSFGLLTPAILDILMRSAPLARGGLMGATQMAATQLGGVLAIAALGSIVASRVVTNMDAGLAHAGLHVALGPATRAALTQGIVHAPAGLHADQVVVFQRVGLSAFARAMGAAFTGATVMAALALITTLAMRRTLVAERRH